MPYNRFYELEEEKKMRIFETAMRIFSEKSFKLASINTISKEAGLSAGALYYYFEDKEDLFYSTLDYVSKVIWKDMGDTSEVFKNLGYWEGITAMVLKRLELSFSHPQFMRLFERVLLSNDPVESDGRLHLLDGFKNIFEYGYKHGFIRTDLPKSLLFDIHFNMTITVNQWTLKTCIEERSIDYHSEDLKDLSIKTVEMIKKAMSKEME